MELRLLRYFLMVAQEENMTRAAALLHITQPTLSRQMAQLEEELGVPLFLPGRHPLALTEDGLLLKRRAREILELTEKTERELADRDKVLAGEVSVGIGETRNMDFLSAQIAAFRREHPRVRFQVYTATADMIKERIENGLLDMGVLTFPADARKYDYLFMPLKDRWSALVRKDSPLAEKGALSARDLKKTPLILPQRREVREGLLKSLSLREEELTVAGYSNLEMNGAAMVREGIGIFLCLETDRFAEDLCYLPLEPSSETESVLVWKKEQSISRAAAAFLGAVRSASPSLRDS